MMCNEEKQLMIYVKIMIRNEMIMVLRNDVCNYRNDIEKIMSAVMK
jgi:hypothetical protein